MYRPRSPLLFVFLSCFGLALIGILTWRFQLYIPVAQGLSFVSGTVYGWSSRMAAAISQASGADYMRCVVERDMYAKDAAELRSLRAENLALKTALNYADSHSVNTVTARVAASHYKGTSQLLTIDRGRMSGIAQGQAVVVMDGILIGKVIAVQDATATVMLLSDAKSKTSVILVDDEGNEISGILEGDRGITIVVSLIPQDRKIVPNSQVITAGLDSTVPRGLLIGTVGRIEKQEGEAFQRAVITPPDSARYPAYVSVFTVDSVP